MSKPKGRKILHDLTNEHFGHVVAKKVVRTVSTKGAIWLCECTNCNSTLEVDRTRLLNSSATFSCGCLFGFNKRVADLAGVAQPTVSQVLKNKSSCSQETIYKIKAIAKKLKQSKQWGKDGNTTLRRKELKSLAHPLGQAMGAERQTS